jgi:hypothetical protein
MSKRIKSWLKNRKSPHERAKEPFSLSPNPILQESKLAAVIAIPFLVFISVLLYIATTYYITQEEFAIMSTFGLVLWICMLIMIFAYCKSQASEYILFDREFGWTPRLHPRCEIYCKPEDIRQLISPEDKLEKPEDFEARLKTFGLDEKTTKLILKAFNNNFSKYLYYFRHKDYFMGWDPQKHEVPLFKSHLVFQDYKFEDQYTFGAGQENWYGPILYNHSHAESDNVKGLGWALDPFTNEPMPICLLIHSSTTYKNTQQSKDLNLEEAQQMIMAQQHGMIDSLHQTVQHLTVLKDSKFHDVKNIIDFGKDIAKADRSLEEEIMKPVSRNIWGKGWFKALMSVITIAAIVFLIAYVLHWIDLSAIFG